MDKKTVTISFEGPPGSGKTSLSRFLVNLLLAKGFTAIRHPESDKIEIINPLETL